MLRGRPQVSRTAREGEFLLREGRKINLLAFCQSGEGLHIRCLQFPSRKVMEHYSFYLGYEVEPTFGDLDPAAWVLEGGRPAPPPRVP